MDKLTNFFTTSGLFLPDTILHCIVTGAVASTSVIVDDAQSTGMRILMDMMDKEVSEYRFTVSSNAFVWRLRWMERSYLSTHNHYFSVWVWLHLLREMAPNKNHLLISYACALPPSLTTNSSSAVKPIVSCWRHMEVGRFRAYWKASSNACPQCKTDYISTDEAWIKVVLMITPYIQSPTMRPMCVVSGQLLQFLVMFKRTIAFHSVTNCWYREKNM